MITVRRSSRNKYAQAITAVLLVSAAASPSAHRRDEYLQAARIAIDPDRVQITLNLTPGIAVAEDVLADIDRDGDKSISAGEGGAYAGRVLGAIALDVDGVAVDLELVDSAFPATDSMRKGEGTMRVDAAARMPRLRNGPHQLRYRNRDRSDIGVYLANALVPVSDRVAISRQRRDTDQRELIVEYSLAAGNPAKHVGGTVSLAVLGVFTAFAFFSRRRSHARADREPGCGDVKEDLC